MKNIELDVRFYCCCHLHMQLSQLLLISTNFHKLSSDGKLH